MNWGNIIVDSFIVLILLVGIIWGIKAGFIKTVSKPAKIVLAIAFALALASVVGTGIVKPIIEEPVVAKITDFFTEKITAMSEAAGLGDNLPTIIKLAASLANIELSQLENVETQAETITAIVGAITDPILNIISMILGFVVCFFIGMILFTILFAILDSVVDDGVLGVVNKVLGCIVMTLLAIAIIWVLCTVSDLILNLPWFRDQAWAQEFTGGWIYTFFKNLSPVDLILNLLLSF